MATWADVRSVLVGLPGTRESEGAWRVAGRVLARPVAGDAVAVWQGDDWLDVPLGSVGRDDLAALLTEAWEQRAPGRLVRERKGTS